MNDLSKEQRDVLKFLYEHKDDREPPIDSEIAIGTGLSLIEVRRALFTLVELGFVEGEFALRDHAVKALRNLDPKFGPTDERYAEHILLLAAAIDRVDEEHLAAELGYDPEFVKTVGARLRAADIWRGTAVNERHVQAWIGNGYAFWADGLVAAGIMTIEGNSPDGEPRYKATESGMRDAANIVKRLSGRK